MSYEPTEDHVYVDMGGSEPPSRGWRGLLVAVVVGAVVVLALVAGARAIADWISGLDGLGEDTDEVVEIQAGRVVTLVIPAGTTSRGIASLLVSEGVISSSAEFESAVRSAGVEASLKAGRYELVAGTDLSEIVDLLIAGPNIATFRLSLIEGLRIDEVLAGIASQTEFSPEQLATLLTEGSVTSDFLPVPGQDLEAWEGLLFPETYEFFADEQPERILQRLSDETRRRVSQFDWSSLEQRGVSIYEAMIMASIIESEAATDVDRPLIASVLNNRLSRGMPLQIDSTVLYALGERGRALSLTDLEVVSDYNTYLNPGLPPTPIGTFGARSLEAVASPAQTDFIYYVLTSQDGTHSFFVEYEDFLQAKETAEAQGIGQ